MKTRLALLALPIVAVVALVVYRSQPPSSSSIAARTISAAEPDSAVAISPFPGDSSLKFEVMRDRALTPYRLRPDRRFVLALAEIRRLAGASDSAVTYLFTSGRWALKSGSQDIGKLSELPDFPEMLDVATEWARTQAWARGWSDNAGPERPDLWRALDRLDAPAALREADRAWATGARDAALFRDAAHAYALLALETPDWAGLSDAIAARSLASLAYARALGAEDPKREACLLAEAMGYSGAAREQARRLPSRDPLRLYVAGDEAGLERLATETVASAHPSKPEPAKPAAASKTTVASKTVSAKSATSSTTRRASGARKSGVVAKRGTTRSKSQPVAKGPSAEPGSVSFEAPFFHLLQTASTGDDPSWTAALASFDHPGIPTGLVLGGVIRVQRPGASTLAAERLLTLTTKPAAGPKGSRGQAAPSASLLQYLQRAEAALAGQLSLKGAVLLEPDLTRAQKRSLVYAAIERIAQHALETMDPAELTRWSAMGPSKSTAKRVLSFQRWYSHRVNAQIGRPEVAALRADVDSAAAGPSQALRSYQALRAHLAADDPSLRDAARGLVRRMDGRLDDRNQVAILAERDLGALTVAEKLGTSAAAASGSSDPALSVWRTRFPSEADTLRTGQTTPAQAMPDSVLGTELARRLTAHPTSWEAADRYAAWLERRGSYTSARHVLERWVTRCPQDSGSTGDAEVRTRIAHLLQLDGHPEQGLQLIDDLYRGGQFGATARTALILQDMGQSNQALAIAWAAHRRAPYLAAGRAVLAELFWHQGRYDEAAKILRDGRAGLTSRDWTLEIAPRFVGFFRTRESEGVQAAEALVRAGFSERSTLGAIPEALGDEGADALAFELQSRMQPAGAEGFESAILAYGHLQSAKGESAALTWLRSRVAERDRDLLGILAYQERHPELLWTMAPPRLQGEVGDYHWLLRAATVMAAGQSDPHYAETVGYVGRARGSYHLEIARYLLGLREGSEILAMAQTLRQRSEACYFAGLKAEQRGRLRDAADWYLMSVESDTGNNIESRWAMKRLKQWTSEGARPDRTAPAQPPPA